MNFNMDFLKYFGKVEIVHLCPTGMDGDGMEGDINREFEVFPFKGRWSRESNTAGGCGNDGMRNFVTNPQFSFSLTDPDPYDDELKCPIIVSLSQKMRQRKTEWSIGFKIYRCPPGQSKMEP